MAGGRGARRGEAAVLVRAEGGEVRAPGLKPGGLRKRKRVN
jgi:hypothetical protein